jgi:hypothetical protein
MATPRLVRSMEAIGRAPTKRQALFAASPVLLSLWDDIADVAGLAKRRMLKDRAFVLRAVEDLNRKAAPHLDLTSLEVRGGPFQGMTYLPESSGSVLGPKLLGTYEAEIAPWLDEVIASDVQLVVDVGCAEGYYAVGLARALPQAQVYAYDADPEARRLVADLAGRNQVADRLQVRGWLGHAEIAQHSRDVPGDKLLFVDIEGGEDALLDPQACPALRDWRIIVELHEPASPGVTYRLLDRFARSHVIDLVAAVPDAERARFLTDGDEVPAAAVAEGRATPQLWARMRPF